MPDVDMARGSASHVPMRSDKAWSVVFRTREGRLEVLAFDHPSAGKQFVKGTIAAGELPSVAAERELREESGIGSCAPMTWLGTHKVRAGGALWHFFACSCPDLPETWAHATEDDHGHTFVFFWRPIDEPLDQDWHPMFHEAFAFFRPRLLAILSRDR